MKIAIITMLLISIIINTLNLMQQHLEDGEISLYQLITNNSDNTNIFVKECKIK